MNILAPNSKTFQQHSYIQLIRVPSQKIVVIGDESDNLQYSDVDLKIREAKFVINSMIDFKFLALEAFLKVFFINIFFNFYKLFFRVFQSPIRLSYYSQCCLRIFWFAKILR